MKLKIFYKVLKLFLVKLNYKLADS
jgi:hypothetical protein